MDALCLSWFVSFRIYAVLLTLECCNSGRVIILLILVTKEHMCSVYVPHVVLAD